MPDDQPDAPSAPPPYPGSPPPAYPGSGGQSALPRRDDWYTPPRETGGYYYPPGSPPPAPPGQWGGDPRYGYGQGGAPVATYASYWARVGGFLIDSILISVVSLLYELPAHSFHTSHTVVNGVATAHLRFDSGGVIVPIVIGALYAGLLIGLRGQTLGMMAARIRAVDAASGQVIGFWRAVGRDLFERVLAFLLVIPWIIDMLFPAWDPRRQTLHDKVTNTVVVRT